MTLHCVYAVAALRDGSLPRALNTGDCVLLLGSAVTVTDWREHLPATTRLCALGEDLDAYGVNWTDADMERIDYDGWVALTTALTTQQVWA
jgi:sulfur relay protein TusB/DsrH